MYAHNTEIIEVEQRVSDLKSARDAALALGRNAQAADLNEKLSLEERMLEEQRRLATPKPFSKTPIHEGDYVELDQPGQ